MSITKRLQVFKKPRPIVCLCLLALLLVGAILSTIFLPMQYAFIGGSNTDGVYREHGISPDATIVETIIADSDFDRIGLLFAASTPHYPSGTLNITITAPDQPDILCAYPLSELVDTVYVYCDYNGDAGQEYQITINTIDNQLPYGFVFASSATNPNTTLSLSGETSDLVIIAAFLVQKPDYFIFWYYLMAAVLVICYLVLYIDKEAYDPKN